MKVGVLALQGDVREHAARIRDAGAVPVPVRTQSGLDGVDALVLPGGESTAIGMLLDQRDMLEPLRERIGAGFPVFGTCAGLILLASRVGGGDVPRIGVLDAEVTRNAYGRQAESFETDIDVAAVGSVRAVFIRAPVIEEVGPDVQVLAELGGRPVLVRQGRVLAGSFHPELTGDDRIHRYFLDEVCA